MASGINMFFVASLFFGIAFATPIQRIIFGEEVSIHEIPFLASLSSADRDYQCGGAILTSYYILTSALCAMQDGIKVRVGSSHRTNGGHLIEVSSTTIHPEYDGAMEANIALLGLKEPIIFDNTAVMQAPLPYQNLPVPEGLVGFIAGWGMADTLKRVQMFSENLQIGLVTTNSQEYCSSVFPALPDRIICASPNPTDLCTGDFGGPLVTSGMVTGIGFFGFCGSRYGPSLYTDVAQFTDWIVREASGIPIENGADFVKSSVLLKNV